MKISTLFTHNKDAVSALKSKLLLLLVMLLLATIILYFMGIFNSTSVTAQQFVDLQEGENPHVGFRRAHAKGICIAGTFESTGALAHYSTAHVFDKGVTPFLGRFSIAGNNPLAPDLNAPVRSLAFIFNSQTTQEWRVAMNTPPVMAVATPDAFFEQLKALSPDPLTNKVNPEKVKAFFMAHPETQAFNEWKAGYVPTNSFATEHYHSINAFYLVDKLGNKQAVRWIATPKTSQEDLPALDSASPDALQTQLVNMLATDTIKFDLIFTLANAEDDENNPTIPWPSNRARINAGTLIISSWEAQKSGPCADKNFDPTVLPVGMMATTDPILRARSSAYAESYRRRAKEQLLSVEETLTANVRDKHESK